MRQRRFEDGTELHLSFKAPISKATRLHAIILFILQYLTTASPRVTVALAFFTCDDCDKFSVIQGTIKLFTSYTCFCFMYLSLCFHQNLPSMFVTVLPNPSEGSLVSRPAIWLLALNPTTDVKYLGSLDSKVFQNVSLRGLCWPVCTAVSLIAVTANETNATAVNRSSALVKIKIRVCTT